MVLHNSKWDKRAKTRYLKKHGLVSKDSDKCEEISQSEVTSHASQTQDVPHVSDVSPEDTSAEETSTGAAVNVIDLPDYEEDEEQEKLIRAHIARQKYTVKPNAIPISDKSIFEQAEAGYERSKLNQAVRKHIGRQAKKIDMDSDSDFEHFMDELSDSEVEESTSELDAEPSIEVTGSQQQLLDKLLN